MSRVSLRGFSRCDACGSVLSEAQRRGHTCPPELLVAHWTVRLREELEGEFLTKLDAWAHTPKVRAWLAFMRWREANE
jgi:hypothetical protein